VLEHVDAVELRVFVAEVLAVAADAVLIGKHFLILCAHLVTALARLHVRDLTRRISLEAGSKRDKKSGEEGRNLKKTPCGSLARETGNAGGARACIPIGKVKRFYHSKLSSFGTVQSTLGLGGCGHGILA
jgi:hypothetical protein